MLSDFLTLEVYFGSQNSALYFEDLVKNYGRKKTERAIRDGDLECKATCLSGRGRLVTWLSEQGRSKAQSALS